MARFWKPSGRDISASFSTADERLVPNADANDSDGSVSIDQTVAVKPNTDLERGLSSTC